MYILAALAPQIGISAACSQQECAIMTGIGATMSCRGRRQATAAASHRVKADALVVQWIPHFNANGRHPDPFQCYRCPQRPLPSPLLWLIIGLVLGSRLPLRSCGCFYPNLTRRQHAFDGSGAGRERPSFSHGRGPSTIDVFWPPGQSIPANPATSALVHRCWRQVILFCP